MNLNRSEKRVIGEKLRLAILDANFTYDELADELGLTSSRVIYEWVNGNKLPSIKNLVILKHILGVSLDEILAV